MIKSMLTLFNSWNARHRQMALCFSEFYGRTSYIGKYYISINIRNFYFPLCIYVYAGTV
jgi:hypothetical protein